MDREKSGIHGLDEKIGGGLRPNSITTIIGSAGTGKTVFLLQFALEGLMQGENVLFISLEEATEQLLQEAELVGLFGIRDYFNNGKLVFYEADPSQLYDLTITQLPTLIKASTGEKTRIIIDSLTPYLWNEPNKTMQRTTIWSMFKTLRALGTTVISVEQLQLPGEQIVNEESYVPLFLADSAFILKYFGSNAEYGRSFRVIKHRGSFHTEKTYPLNIVTGFGIVVLDAIGPNSDDVTNSAEVFANFQALVTRDIPDETLRNQILSKIALMQQNWPTIKDPTEILSTLMRQYNVRI